MPQKPSKNVAGAATGTKANQGEPEPTRRRGPKDLVHRARSQIWLAIVKSHRRTPGDHPAMGRFFLGDVEEAARVFVRIEYYASDPGIPRPDKDTVVERVAAKPGFAHTKLVYDSALWRLLGPTLPSPDEREEMINQAIRQLIFVERMQDPALRLLVRVASICRLPTPASAYRRVIRRFARKRSITCLLLLCLLYRRAIEVGAVDEVRILREGVLAAVRHFCNRPGFSGAAFTLLLFLVRRRVLAGQSSLEHTLEMQLWAEDVLADWSVRCTTPEEHQWLERQTWLVACAIENLEQTQIFERTYELPAEIEALICERDVRQAVTRDPTSRRIEQQCALPEDDEAALPT